MQITYKDKVTLQSNPNIPDENKVTAKDMNEIKSAVNSNEEEQQALNMSVQEIAQNVVNNGQEISNIKEEQTTQNNRLNSLEVDNTTNKSDILTNKQEINNIKTEQTEQNTNISTNATNIETLQEENESLKKIVSQLPQVEGQGTSITLENTIEAQFTKFDVEGNSVQDGTPSPDNEQPIYSAGDNIQLFDKTTVVTNKYINNQGEEVAGAGFDASDFISVNPNTNIVLSGNNFIQSTHGAKGAFYNINKEFVSYVNIAIGNNVYAVPNTARYFRFSLKPNDLDIIKVEKGSIATPWSPYGMGSINEKIQTRNWFDVSKISQLIKNGATTTGGITNIDNVITINKTNGQHGSYAMNYLMPIKSGKITVSFKALVSGTHSNTGILVALYNSTATIYATTAQTKYASSKDKWLDYNATFELNQEAIDGIHLDIQAANTGNVIQIKDIQVELGTTSTTYVPHEEQDYSIFVQQPMRSIGDVRDKFVKVNGNWFERHCFGEVNQLRIVNGPVVQGFYIIPEGIKKGAKLLSTHQQLGTSENSEEWEKYDGSQMKQLYPQVHNGVYINYKADTKQEQVDWWNSLNATLLYELETPLDLPCTEEQIQQLENLPSTYKDFTIIQSQDETPAYLEVSGIRDINTMFDKVTNAIVSLGGNV